MQKSLNGSTPQEKSRLVDQLEDAELSATDPAEKAKLTQLVSQLRSAIVGTFVKQPSNADEAKDNNEK